MLDKFERSVECNGLRGWMRRRRGHRGSLRLTSGWKLFEKDNYFWGYFLDRGFCYRKHFSKMGPQKDPFSVSHLVSDHLPREVEYPLYIRGQDVYSCCKV